VGFKGFGWSVSIFVRLSRFPEYGKESDESAYGQFLKKKKVTTLTRGTWRVLLEIVGPIIVYFIFVFANTSKAH
jgi:hypothetical protein